MTPWKVELFNQEAFWESHEVLEGPWRETGSDFYHGVAAGPTVPAYLPRDVKIPNRPQQHEQTRTQSATIRRLRRSLC